MLVLLYDLLQVPGNLVISARSGVHSFDASQMNMSHVVSHLSFGKKITEGMMNDIKRLLPYAGGSHDKLNGQAYITHHGDNANVTVSFSITLFTLPPAMSYHLFCVFPRKKLG